MDALYQMALQRYNEILLIRDYISQGEDLYYRKRILENKNSEFLQFVSYRTQIKTAMDKFETSLFNQYYSLLKREMEDY